MTQTQDFLVECNEFGVPVEDFTAAHCSRCLQKECHRSQHGRSRFEARVGSWQERLFTNVPRMAASDSRLVTLQAKRFVEVPGRIPEVGSWLDPRDLDQPAVSPQAMPIQPVAEAPPPPAPPPPAPPPPAPLVEAPQDPARTRTAPRLMNTPVSNGRMIGGRVPPAPSDPWAAKPQETAGLKVVKPGARIKLGSGV